MNVTEGGAVGGTHQPSILEVDGRNYAAATENVRRLSY